MIKNVERLLQREKQQEESAAKGNKKFVAFDMNQGVVGGSG